MVSKVNQSHYYLLLQLNPQLNSTIQNKVIVDPIDVDYDSMSKDELKVILDEKGIKYLYKDTKEDLINKLK